MIQSMVKDLLIQGSKPKQERNYYREVEKLLYSLPALEERLVQEEEALKHRIVEMPKRSKSVVRFSHNFTLLTCDPDEYIESLKMSLQLTRLQVERIHKALDSIRSWPHYCLIEYKYFKNMTNAQIGNLLFLDPSNISRHKNRMIKQLCIIFFGRSEE